MTFAQAQIPDTMFDEYLERCFKFMRLQQFYSFEVDCAAFGALFGNRPLWG